jgi:hypothetical protein
MRIYICPYCGKELRLPNSYKPKGTVCHLVCDQASKLTPIVKVMSRKALQKRRDGKA